MNKVPKFYSNVLHDKSDNRYLSNCLPGDGPEIGPKYVLSNNKTVLILGSYADGVIELCK